jgi:hypothetical protein
METQVQSNPKIAVPPNGKVIVSGDEYEDSMIDMDDFDLAKIFKQNIGMDLSPVAKPEMEEQINKLMAKGNTFRKFNESYVEKYVTQGNKELYEMLAGIYGFMLTVNESPYRDHILKRMREWLIDEQSIVLSESTAIESIVVRYIIPTDRQTAFNYARVLKVAFLEKLVAKDLAGYITGRGGITKIQDTKANEDAAKEAKEVAKKKLSLYKKILQASAKAINETVEIPKSKQLNLVSAGKKEALFQFAVVDNKNGDTFRIHQVVALPEAIGEQWLNYISQTVVNDDVEMVQDELDKLRAQLGITGGWGMAPGDKGYVPHGNVTAPPVEKEVNEEPQEAE